jgi:site-specific recombinase XerD
VAARRAARFELETDAGLRTISWQDFQAEFLTSQAVRLKPSSLKRYSFVLGRFGRFLDEQGIETVHLVGPETINRFLLARQSDIHPTRRRSITPEGLKADLRILKRVFSVARTAGCIRENPVRQTNLSSRAGQTRPFDAAELQRLLADSRLQGDLRLRAQVLTFLYTGLRISDVIGLESASLKPGERVLVVRTEKRGKSVALPLHPELACALEGYQARRNPAQRASPWLFSTRSGKPAKNLAAYLHRLFVRCGIQGGHPHRFRDTFAVQLLARGASLYDVAKLLGTTVGVAERHYAPYVEELRERGRRLILGMEYWGTPCTTGVQSRTPKS